MSFTWITLSLPLLLWSLLTVNIVQPPAVVSGDAPDSVAAIPGHGGGPHADINWLPLEEAARRAKMDGRKLYILLYAEDDASSKRMEAYTLQDPNIVRYINDNYYAARFDAESRESVRINGKVYRYEDGQHEFAAYVTHQSSVTYPTSVFMDSELELLQSIPNVIDRQHMHKILVYYGNDHHHEMPWARFSREYQQRQVRKGQEK